MTICVVQCGFVFCFFVEVRLCGCLLACLLFVCV